MAFTKGNLNKEFYTTGDIAKIFNVSPKTVQKWDKKEQLVFERSPSNRRIVSRENLIEYLKSKNMFFEQEDLYKRDIIYARVSSRGQKKQGDLERQVDYILSKNNDLKNVLVMKEVGSGLNSKRKKILQLIKMVMNDEVNRIFITYKDRLTRFGFEYIETICKMKDVEIVIMQQGQDKKSIQEELAEDIMSLLASFSGKLYGLRSHKNKKDIQDEKI